jgi:hypothetical protein
MSKTYNPRDIYDVARVALEQAHGQCQEYGSGLKTGPIKTCPEHGQEWATATTRAAAPERPGDVARKALCALPELAELIRVGQEAHREHPTPAPEQDGRHARWPTAHVESAVECICPRCTPGLHPPTPAAMLGEALVHVTATTRLIERACGVDPLAGRVRKSLDDAFALLLALRSEAEARGCDNCEGVQPESCWQCAAPLGTTEDCMTCAAKRNEDGKPCP